MIRQLINMDVEKLLKEKLRYKLNGVAHSIELEDWMKFAIFIGSFIKNSDSAMKIYVSIPSNLLFSYFAVLGAIDYDFENSSKEILKKKYLSLQNGHRVLYLSGDQWKSCSVLRVSQSPVNPNIKTVVILDNLKTTVYVPEHQWLTHIRFLDDQVIEVKNAKIAKNISHLCEDPILTKFYSEKKLSIVESLNNPHTYIYANKKEWLDYLENLKFEYKSDEIELRNFIFWGTESPFKNIDFISKIEDYKLPVDSTIIFLGSTRTIRRMEQFDHYKCIYLIDKHDSTEKLEDLRFKIEQQFLIQGCVTVNEELLEALNRSNIRLPKGVELLAWKQKS
jgi:hypothetical protein